MYLIAVIVYAADQLIKWIVQTHLVIDQSVQVIPGFIGLLYIRNPGAAWSMLANGRWLLAGIELLVGITLIYVKQRYKPGRLASVGMGLLLAGTMGNATDRIISGTVVDYLQFLFIHFPIFNLADISIDAGIILLLWNAFRAPQDDTKKHGPHRN